MSAVYWICPNIHCMFAKPLELTVEHCAHLKHPDYHTKLTFLRTKCNQEDLPYKFKEIGGQFTAHSGTVALRSFSGVAVGSKSAESTPPLMKYVARIVTLQTHVTEWKTQYAVLKDLKSFRVSVLQYAFTNSITKFNLLCVYSERCLTTALNQTYFFYRHLIVRRNLLAAIRSPPHIQQSNSSKTRYNWSYQ